MKKTVRSIVLVAVVAAIIAIVLGNYSFVFSKTVRGEIIGVERVAQPTAILGSGKVASEALFSFSVLIRSENGEMFTASSEDRQWAVAKVGYCVEARFYPYPFWDLQSSGTYFNARLLKMMDCKHAKPGIPSGAPVAVSPAEPASAPPESAPVTAQ